MPKKALLGLSLTVALLGASACGGDNGGGGDGGNGSASPEAQSTESPQAQPTPDLSGVPDVVAEVNGEEVTKDEFVSAYEGQFQQQAMQAQMSGQELDQDQMKEQTANSLVDTELLIQEAGNRDLEATEKAKEQTLNEVVEQNQLGSADEFYSAMEEQGMDREQVDSQLETQVQIDQVIADEAGDIEPTEEELRQLYEQQKQQQEAMGQGQGGQGGQGNQGGQGGQQQMPPYEEVKPQLKEQAEMQKEGEVAQTLVEGLRENADISINL